LNPSSEAAFSFWVSTRFSAFGSFKKKYSAENACKEVGPMLSAVHFTCSLPKSEADALNAESGRIYTDMLVSHYRLYRKQGVWLTHQNGERWEDQHGGRPRCMPTAAMPPNKASTKPARQRAPVGSWIWR
jgi:hypothetical protein